jgi:hypothetical protein
MGPIFKYAVPSTLEVTQDETMILFSTRSVVEEGFTGLTVKDRTWATYLKPPYLYCVLLSPMEHQNDFETPMKKTLSQLECPKGIDQVKLSEIYHMILSKTETRVRDKLSTKPEVQQLLNTLQNNPNPLRPTWSLQTGYCYPEAEEITGLRTSETNDLLATMQSAGLLNGRICGNIVLCPKCNSHQVLLHASCPKCGLPTLETGIALEHFICDHTAFIEEYSTSTGLVCPHCKSYLTPGTYRSPGKVFHCITCNSYPKRPEKRLGCLNCKDTFTPDQAKYTPIYCYTAP